MDAIVDDEDFESTQKKIEHTIQLKNVKKP